MVIPAKDYDEYEIMVNVEQICELVDNQSSKCLRHIIQDKASSTIKAKLSRDKRKGLMAETRPSKNKPIQEEVSTKSRITFVSSSKGSKPSKIGTKMSSKQSKAKSQF
jgi:hypothetical protein